MIRYPNLISRGPSRRRAPRVIARRHLAGHRRIHGSLHNGGEVWAMQSLTALQFLPCPLQRQVNNVAPIGGSQRLVRTLKARGREGGEWQRRERTARLLLQQPGSTMRNSPDCNAGATESEITSIAAASNWGASGGGTAAIFAWPVHLLKQRTPALLAFVIGAACQAE